jgi:adenosylcobyric acid synthase
MKPIMIQGTSTNAGKTTLVAGLCRMFANRGLRVAPFKAQNMALNSYVTEHDEEIGRSTAVQAVAARQTPTVHMNPILLKPKSDGVSQVIIHGKVYADVSASDYFKAEDVRSVKLAALRESIGYLKNNYDLIIAEGAGSCAEPNLREYDVVNMAAAHLLNADVYIAADIDKGGVFADMLGTLRVIELTEKKDLALIRGFIINKFRGDTRLLDPAIHFAERETGLPIIGVVPYLDLNLEEEDRVRVQECENPEVEIAVVHLPRISNANDFDPLMHEPRVRVSYVKRPEDLGEPDAIILPGTKNTIEDLLHLRSNGMEKRLLEMAGRVPLIGICGGFEMLGNHLLDEGRVESTRGSTRGLGLLNFDIHFLAEKTVTRRNYTPTPSNPLRAAGPVSGYEIHHGATRNNRYQPLYDHSHGQDGAIHPERPIWGTFIHDLFRNPHITRSFVNKLRTSKGLPLLTAPTVDYSRQREASYDLLAEVLENTLTLP